MIRKIFQYSQWESNLLPSGKIKAGKCSVVSFSFYPFLVLLVRHSVYEKKWPVTPSELWNSKRIKRIPNTKTPIWCEKCITRSF